jgi:iron complex outermembrane receptor protein
VLGDFVPFPLVRAIPGTLGPQGNQYTFTEELQFQGISGDLSWQGGGYAEISNPIGQQEQYGITFANCTDVYAFKCTPLTVNIPGRGPTPIGAVSILRHNYYYRNYGLYAQGTYKFSEQFSLTGGLRYTWDTTRATGDNVRVVAFPTGPVAFSCGSKTTPAGAGTAALLSNKVCFASFREQSGKPTWLINLDYNPDESVHLYAKYARGYRAGGANPSNTGFETWSPEGVDNYEIGVKTTIRGGAVRGTFNVAGFWNDFTNQQVPISRPACTLAAQGAVCTNPASAGVQAIQNIGTSRIRGVEIDGSLTFFDDFRLDYGYAYLDAKVKNTSFPGCDTSRFACATADVLQPGQRLLFSPKHRLTLTGTYALPLDESMGELSVGATYVHTAKSFFSHNADVPFALGEIPFNSSVLPASDLVNLNLTWNRIGGSPIDLGLFATNVTKEKYTVGAGNALRTVGADFIFVGEPRMFGARVRFNFGS